MFTPCHHYLHHNHNSPLSHMSPYSSRPPPLPPPPPPFFVLMSSILSHPFLAGSPSSILCLLIHYFVLCCLSLFFLFNIPSVIHPPFSVSFCLFYFVCFVIFGCSKSHSFCPCSIRASTSPDPVSVATNTPAATGNLTLYLSPRLHPLP